MKKLLHERLREDDGVLCPIKALKGIDACQPDWDCRDCRNNALSDLADEIERYYIPRPRFEDGEPVQFGDATDELYHVDTISFYEDGGISLNSVDSEIFIGVGKTLKRPTPKVYDTDGVEIKVGDIVWSTVDPDHEPLKVKELAEDNRFKAEGSPDTFYFIAKYFTKERPVLDAEGVRICNGDTVYDVAGINPEPMRVLSYGDALVNVMSKSGIEKNYEFNELTHREPDSFNKAMERFQSILEDKDGLGYGTEDKLWEVHKRLTALIERGA